MVVIAVIVTVIVLACAGMSADWLSAGAAALSAGVMLNKKN
ncbi:hypothetical protein [Actinacidiphila cocklensis]|nr:hypothetical protein [Actinacidiphila cocklensis]